MAGQYDVAKVALQELRRVQPNVSLAWIANQIPIKRDADREHYLEGFRRAGYRLAVQHPAGSQPGYGSSSER